MPRDSVKQERGDKEQPAKGVRKRAPEQRVSRANVRSVALEQALGVSFVIRDQLAKEPTNVLDVAKASQMSPIQLALDGS
jgi:hypothetical protein